MRYNERLLYKDEFGDIHTVDKINHKWIGDKAVREKLFDYEQEEVDGKLIHLPCKIGDTVYYFYTRHKKQGHKKVTIENIESGIVDNITLGQTMVPQVTVCNNDNNYWISFDTKSDFDRIIFLTKEKAEQALEESEISNKYKTR